MRAGLFAPWFVGLLLGLGLFAARAEAKKCPNLVIVLDKSGSMDAAPDGGTAPPGGTKWELAQKAVAVILERYDGQLPIGLSLFAGDGVCGAGKLEVPPEYNSKKKINDKINAAQPHSATPTSETVNNLRMEATLKDPSRDQYMLLLTDGEPTCASGEPDATVKALSDACKQTPGIKTFVVGFGALPGTASAAMDRMADAGCAPVMGAPRKYYAAESPEELNKALDAIFQTIIMEGGVVACDDSCYSPDVGCPNPSDLCIRAECKPNPCAGISCGPGLYCFTDGTTPGRCVGACKSRCPDTQRCEMGKCIKDACPFVCPAGSICNPAAKRCDPDPLCPDNRPQREQCKGSSRCQFGQCVDDPCKFITCPKDTRCVPWNGSCEYIGSGPVAKDMAGSDDEDPVDTARGCNAGPSSIASSSAALTTLLILGLFILRRRTKNLPRA